jgi:hypothetical protein
MNKIATLLEELHEAETELADEYLKVAERQAAEHDVYYLCRTLSKECDARAAWMRDLGSRFGKDLSEPNTTRTVTNILSGARRKTSEMLGRRPQSGILLLRDLRQLYLMAEEANIHWLILGQVAQALRDKSLLDQVSALHKQLLTQIKWLKTRIKESSPQTLVVAD